MHLLRPGNLPINPSGGLKSRGHPVGATGLAQIVDCVKQMRNKVSDSRQVEKNKIRQEKRLINDEKSYENINKD